MACACCAMGTGCHQVNGGAVGMPPSGQRVVDQIYSYLPDDWSIIHVSIPMGAVLLQAC